MEGGHLPYCEDCIVPLTVKHILIECPTFNNEILTFYNNYMSSMKVGVLTHFCVPMLFVREISRILQDFTGGTHNVPPHVLT